MYRRRHRTQLFALGSDLKSAAAHKQGEHQYQAARIDIEVEVSHFTAAAAQEQDYQQNPSAVATAETSAAVFATASAVVKHTVEHSLPPFIYLTCQSNSQYGLISKSVTF